MPGKDLDNACLDCQAAEAALNIRNRRLCQYDIVSHTLKRIQC
jgi:hypothetical protein